MLSAASTEPVVPTWARTSAVHLRRGMACTHAHARAGDIVQLDISNPDAPRVAGRVWVGGQLRKAGVKVLGGLPDGLTEAPEVPEVGGGGGGVRG